MNKNLLNIIVRKTIDNNAPNDMFTNPPLKEGSQSKYDDNKKAKNFAEWTFSIKEIKENPSYAEKFKKTLYELSKYTFQYNMERYYPEVISETPKQHEDYFRKNTEFLYKECLNAKLPDLFCTDFGEIEIA